MAEINAHPRTLAEVRRAAGCQTATFTPGCRDTGTTVGGMRVYEMPRQTVTSGAEGYSITWTPEVLRSVLGWSPRAPFADGVIPQIGWKKS